MFLASLHFADQNKNPVNLLENLIENSMSHYICTPFWTHQVP